MNTSFPKVTEQIRRSFAQFFNNLKKAEFLSANINLKTEHSTQIECNTIASTNNIKNVYNTIAENGLDTAKRLEGGAEDNPIRIKSGAEADSQNKKIPFPKVIFFIIGNEFCERFNYYGFRTILSLYLTRFLRYTDTTATVIFHTFTMLNYFLCILGAFLSDSWLGKFKTIFYLSVVYVAGSITLTLGAMPPLKMPSIEFTMLGLSLIALGSGGIKPCVSAFGGDQFQLPEQEKQISDYFSFFYFAINFGSLISTTLTPIFRRDIHCFDGECFALGFGVPAVLMLIAIALFLAGYPLYKKVPPTGNMLSLVCKTIWTALRMQYKEKKTNPREHWLDHADSKFDKQLIKDTKALIRIIVLFLPIPFFWALYDQQGSRWVFQATHMNGNIRSWNIQPDQMQLINPLLVLILIPVFQYIIYPALTLIGIKSPLQKLSIGGMFAVVSFIISGILELRLEKTYPVLPKPLEAQLRVFNGMPCDYVFKTNIPNQSSFYVKQHDYVEIKDVPVTKQSFNLEFTVRPKEGSNANCEALPPGNFNMKEEMAFSLFITSKTGTYIWYEDQVHKPTDSDASIRTLANIDSVHTMKWFSKKTGEIYTQSVDTYNLTHLDAGNYRLLIDDVTVARVMLRYGGVYTIIVYESAPKKYNINTIIVTSPNSIHILWQVPQIVMITVSEIMFSIMGLEYSYTQAPVSMKSVVTACWLLTVAFGNIIVVIIAEAHIFDSQASEFFLFACLMFIDMLVFIALAYYYKPNNPLDTN